MRIAIFTDTFTPQINGVTNTLNQLIRQLESRGIEHKIFAPKYDHEADHQEERFYSLKLFLYPECRLALPNIFRIHDSLSKFKPDLIHSFTEFNMGITGLRYGKKHGIPTLSSYTTNFTQYADYYKMSMLKQPIWEYMRWFHNQNELTLCATDEARKLLHRNGIHRTAIFSRGIDTNRFKPIQRSEELRRSLGVDGQKVFLYVGRVSFEKDMDILCKSSRQLQSLYGDKVAFIVTGDGPYLEKCRQLMPGNTVFTGFKMGDELARLYASSDVFVCPSSTETFGNVVLEAMASGLPVIGADAGGVRNLIKDGQNGLTFKARDEEDLTRCMTRLMENESLINHLIKNGLSFCRSRSWKTIVDGLVQQYQYVVENDASSKSAKSSQSA
ncbi:glycosyltransferase family 4 protein [Anoxynatronum buryatiense]|uniref:Glycosyltransferase involved in cell wall bisynthesis n=1 Tax=Anoxynatronum buryatiense TaxID=489973 RepID=A0AA45WTJ9_9CLOT|nr:glycosyltransferase family 1 protein [Anoxynatronum buryatiense]SMP41642.1 Glycosyltransferase involved in cell wall bisynthesis [Anoxynatronum buryatiense]